MLIYSGKMFLVHLVLLVCTFLCFFSFFLVSSRFLQTLIVVEQLNVLVLLGSLLVSGGDFTYFVCLLVLFTLEAVVSLVALTRV